MPSMPSMYRVCGWTIPGVTRPKPHNLVQSWLARVLPVLAIGRVVWAAQATPALIGLGAPRCHRCHRVHSFPNPQELLRPASWLALLSRTITFVSRVIAIERQGHQEHSHRRGSRPQRRECQGSPGGPRGQEPALLREPGRNVQGPGHLMWPSAKRPNRRLCLRRSKQSRPPSSSETSSAEG